MYNQNLSWCKAVYVALPGQTKELRGNCCWGKEECRANKFWIAKPWFGGFREAAEIPCYLQVHPLSSEWAFCSQHPAPAVSVFQERDVDHLPVLSQFLWRENLVGREMWFLCIKAVPSLSYLCCEMPEGVYPLSTNVVEWAKKAELLPWAIGLVDGLWSAHCWQITSHAQRQAISHTSQEIPSSI